MWYFQQFSTSILLRCGRRQFGVLEHFWFFIKRCDAMVANERSPSGYGGGDANMK
jgi:hypothetical protein